jgi:flagellar FliJ protein|tara:strand:+ start:331887 stop:332342 length:456 start_codon:yes stop_codon:yes gene_type:complete
VSGGRVTRYTRLAELASGERDQAAERLRADQARQGAAESQLRQLLAFREEYEQRLTRDSHAGISAVQLREFRRFLGSLTAAIQQQEGLVEQADLALSTRRQELQDHHRKQDRIDGLVQRLRQDEIREREKRDQRMADERFAVQGPQVKPRG